MNLEQEQEFIECGKNFAHFCKYLQVTDPRRGIVPIELRPYHHRLIEAIEANRFVILTKFRQGGFTTLSVLWAFWKCMFRPDQAIMVVSPNWAMAKETSRRLDQIMYFIPSWLEPALTRCNLELKQFADSGSRLMFGIPQATKGRALDAIVIDEAAFCRHMDWFWKAMWPCLSVSPESKAIVVSTTNGMGNWFHETYCNALDGKNKFHVFRAEHTEHPEYKDAPKVDDLRQRLGERVFRQEVLQEFLACTDRAW